MDGSGMLMITLGARGRAYVLRSSFAVKLGVWPFAPDDGLMGFTT